MMTGGPLLFNCGSDSIREGQKRPKVFPSGGFPAAPDNKALLQVGLVYYRKKIYKTQGEYPNGLTQKG